MDSKQEIVKTLLPNLNSSDIKIVAEARQNIISHLSKNCKETWLLIAIIDLHIKEKYPVCLDILNNIPRELHKCLLDKLFQLIQTYQRPNVLITLNHLIIREPAWSLDVYKYNLLAYVIKIMMEDTDIPTLVSASLCITALLPIIPVQIDKYLDSIFLSFLRINEFLLANHKISSSHKVYLRLAVWSLFSRMYGMFPCSLLHFLKKEFFKNNQKPLFKECIEPLLRTVRVHPLLIHSDSVREKNRNRWLHKQPFDIVNECLSLTIEDSQVEITSFSEPPNVSVRHHPFLSQQTSPFFDIRQQILKRPSSTVSSLAGGITPTPTPKLASVPSSPALTAHSYTTTAAAAAADYKQPQRAVQRLIFEYPAASCTSPITSPDGNNKPIQVHTQVPTSRSSSRGAMSPPTKKQPPHQQQKNKKKHNLTATSTTSTPALSIHTPPIYVPCATDTGHNSSSAFGSIEAAMAASPSMSEIPHFLNILKQDTTTTASIVPPVTQTGAGDVEDEEVSCLTNLKQSTSHRPGSTGLSKPYVAGVMNKRPATHDASSSHSTDQHIQGSTQYNSMPAIRTSPCPQLMDTTLRRHSEVINKLLPNAIHKSRDIARPVQTTKATPTTTSTTTTDDEMYAIAKQRLTIPNEMHDTVQRLMHTLPSSIRLRCYNCTRSSTEGQCNAPPCIKYPSPSYLLEHHLLYASELHSKRLASSLNPVQSASEKLSTMKIEISLLQNQLQFERYQTMVNSRRFRSEFAALRADAKIIADNKSMRYQQMNHKKEIEELRRQNHLLKKENQILKSDMKKCELKRHDTEKTMAAMIYELKYEISKVKQEIHDRNKAYKQIKFDLQNKEQRLFQCDRNIEVFEIESKKMHDITAKSIRVSKKLLLANELLEKYRNQTAVLMTGHNPGGAVDLTIYNLEMNLRDISKKLKNKTSLLDSKCHSFLQMKKDLVKKDKELTECKKLLRNSNSLWKSKMKSTQDKYETMHKIHLQMRNELIRMNSEVLVAAKQREEIQQQKEKQQQKEIQQQKETQQEKEISQTQQTKEIPQTSKTQQTKEI